MIIGIGVDAVNVGRMQHWLSVKGLINRFFNQDELDLALKNPKTSALTLSARFAAKEAFGKALGTGLKDIVLKDICVKNQHNGNPDLLVFESAKRAFENSGANIIHLSLTHEKNIAIAVVLLEKI